jgi:hypothetical protein
MARRQTIFQIAEKPENPLHQGQTQDTYVLLKMRSHLRNVGLYGYLC